VNHLIREIQEKQQGNLSVIRIEIDYQLTTLYDAMKKNDTTEIVKVKKRLEELRLKLIELEKDNL